MTPLLAVENLRVAYLDRAGARTAVGGVSFAIEPGEIVALVGESGSGKSSVGLAIMGLLPDHARVAPGGAVRFEGRDLLATPEPQLRDIRGRRIGMVFQEPAAALNPVMRVGDQVAEVAIVHGERSTAAARARAVEMLNRVGLPDAERRYRAWPHELSGGMRQRVMLAIALLLRPALVIADEPTSALDVTVQAQVLRLLLELQRESGTAVLLITHDLGVVAETCSRALVMRGGQVVESAAVDDLFHAPQHAYTRELLAAMPRLERGP
ncbi:MAG TPA: ABC transporter ATP-binding protein [Gemmatimonadaceae bacterium]|nr:ABC transporter ATP-binding protein [Gemmatimonadaceae bacterium]